MKQTIEILKIYIGIDNGVSGSIGWINNLGTQNGFHYIPTISEQDYTKTKKNRTRINNKELRRLLYDINKNGDCIALIERPMVNPGRFQATTSALRALESTLIAIEWCGISYKFIDSKEWQKIMLPSGIKGAPELKKASLDIGKRLFPNFKYKGDADGILIAEWARRTKQ